MREQKIVGEHGLKLLEDDKSVNPRNVPEYHREVIAGHKELAHKIAQLERKLGDHDEQIMVLVEAIKQLMDPRLPP